MNYNNELIAAFDVDGTITKEGNDSWMETTFAMVTKENTPVFETHLKHWKENKKNDPYGESLKMMKAAIDLFPSQTTSELIYDTSKEIAREVFNKDQIRPQAIHAIKKHFDEGCKVVFATTSYREAGQSLLDVLCEEDLISSALKESIVISGTEINWQNREVLHFNMSEGKLDGIAQQLEVSKATVEEKITYAYGDDPKGNDSGILMAANQGFVISTAKNMSVETANIGERVQW